MIEAFMPSDLKNLIVKIAVTGTPGTGKTTITEKLVDRGYKVIHLTEFFEENDIGKEVEGEREIDIEEIKESLERKEFDEGAVIEGHLSHHYPVDFCVVLRCQPEELRERLSGRDYSEEKVEENIEAEKIDIILSEAVQKQETVIEVDTSGKSVEESVEDIIEKIEDGKSDYGNVDWAKFV